MNYDIVNYSFRFNNSTCSRPVDNIIIRDRPYLKIFIIPLLCTVVYVINPEKEIKVKNKSINLKTQIQSVYSN